ncbi:50S ribosomal protein L32 [Mycoplasma sp. SG1]|uniref:50S ribosomal protein L32 n=1 Tax=Mycoplasma sp. SG1 TaxID=2810348 RepID=UPI002023D49E|nr:50S ribosomal protein L32 [Mycoplasma sp. SG1]URM53186.1 50S ribosomal protein L32 [Mycoplasma sp. SG1]
MAVPFRKTSKTRKGFRRSHDHLTAPTIAVCKNCGALHRTHYVCQECGFYKNKKVNIQNKTSSKK